MKVDTAREQRDTTFSAKRKPILTNSGPRCRKLPSRGAKCTYREPTITKWRNAECVVGGGQKRTRSRQLRQSTGWRSTPLAGGDVQHTGGSDHDEPAIEVRQRTETVS